MTACVLVPTAPAAPASDRTIDFARVYRHGIEPALAACRVRWTCPLAELDDPRDAAVLRAVLEADLVIADTTTGDPAVARLLGMREALRAGGLITIAADDGRRPPGAGEGPAMGGEPVRYDLDDGDPRRPTAAAVTLLGRIIADGVAGLLAGNTPSPTQPFRLFPHLSEPDWRVFRPQPDPWAARLESALARAQAGAVLVLADEAPGQSARGWALGRAADLLQHLVGSADKAAVVRLASVGQDTDQPPPADVPPVAAAERPRRVVLFSGHMVDRADRSPPRFPPAAVPTAARQIAAALDRLEIGEADLGLCGGACGGDLLFAEACLARHTRIELYLAEERRAFLTDSVAFAGPAWIRLFERIERDDRCSVLVQPDIIGPCPGDPSVHERCNLWLLYSALARGLDRVRFLCLWDGATSDGEGGTGHMATLVQQLTGHRPIVIDPRFLTGP